MLSGIGFDQALGVFFANSAHFIRDACDNSLFLKRVATLKTISLQKDK